VDNPCPGCDGADSERFCTAFDRFRGRLEPVWEIRRCRGCGFGWTDPPLQEAEIASQYPSAYLGDTERILDEFFSGRLQRGRAWPKETEKVRLVERFCAPGRILDVGCAEGKFLWALDPARWRRTGVEFSATVVELVREKMPDLELIAGDIYNPGLPAESFDVITFWHVLEHLPGPQRVLGRVAELLRPGGTAVISLPNLASLQAWLFRQDWYPFDDVPRHLYHFSPRPLERLILGAGLQPDRQLFFSRDMNFHSLKHSTLNWSRRLWRSRMPYYPLKPLLYLFQLLEGVTGRTGMRTFIARKPL